MVLPVLADGKTRLINVSKMEFKSKSEYEKNYKSALSLYETSHPGDYLFGFREKAPPSGAESPPPAPPVPSSYPGYIHEYLFYTNRRFLFQKTSMNMSVTRILFSFASLAVLSSIVCFNRADAHQTRQIWAIDQAGIPSNILELPEKRIY